MKTKKATVSPATKKDWFENMTADKVREFTFFLFTLQECYLSSAAIEKHPQIKRSFYGTIFYYLNADIHSKEYDLQSVANIDENGKHKLSSTLSFVSSVPALILFFHEMKGYFQEKLMLDEWDGAHVSDSLKMFDLVEESLRGIFTY